MQIRQGQNKPERAKPIIWLTTSREYLLAATTFQQIIVTAGVLGRA